MLTHFFSLDTYLFAMNNINSGGNIDFSWNSALITGFVLLVLNKLFDMTKEIFSSRKDINNNKANSELFIYPT